MQNNRVTTVAFAVLTLLSVLACSPRVEVAVPDKPININLNVKIEHEIKVRVERDLEDAFKEHEELF